jgi:hypothetical protein
MGWHHASALAEIFSHTTTGGQRQPRDFDKPAICS